MKFAIIGSLCCLLAPASADAEAKPTPQLRCEIGPVHRKFGGADWLVYSCDDGHTMVVVSTEENPAAPFYFVLTPEGGGYRIDGEGNGNKQFSDVAGDELSRMGTTDLEKLLADTKSGSQRKR